MPTELLIAVLAGLGGMLGWGFADLFAKKTIDQIGDVVSLAWAHIFGTIALFLVFIFKIMSSTQKVTIPHSLPTWGLLLFFGALQAVVYLFVYKGFGKGQVAVLNPVFASFSGLVAVFSIVFFGEIVSGGLVFSLAIIFLGLLLLNIDIQALKSRRLNFIRVPGFKEVGLATLFATFWTLFWDKFVSGQDWLLYALLMYVFMTIVILIVAKIKKIKMLFANPSMWKFLILIGVCEVVAYVAISLGYSKTTFTSVVALLSGAFSLPTIIMARVFLKEKVTRAQTVGGFVIIIGIILLALL